MKYCPYCGADLVDGTVSFCQECGKKLNVTQGAAQDEPKKEAPASNTPPCRKAEQEREKGKEEGETEEATQI